MRFITLPFDDSFAEGYNNVPSQEKNTIQSLLNQVLGKILQERRNAGFLKSIEKTATEAETNGLTREKLAEIMEWDEETVKNLFGA
jgi:hypothetical protein